MNKLTKRAVDAAEVRPGDYFIWDGDLPGFGLRVLPSGRKRYIVQYRTGRRSRRISLGASTVLTCEQARSQAIAILAACRNGDDPGDRDTIPRQKNPFPAEPLVGACHKTSAAHHGTGS